VKHIRLGTTGGPHVPGKQTAIDHVTFITVCEGVMDIVNLRLSGIFDKTGKLPLNANEICLEVCSK